MASPNEETENVERLRKIIAENRAVVTKFEREATHIVRLHGNNLNTDSLAKLESIENTLKQKELLLAQLDEKILAECNSEDIEKEIEEASEVASKIQEIISKIKACKEGKYVRMVGETPSGLLNPESPTRELCPCRRNRNI